MSLFNFVNDEETIDILYNTSYGGFGVSAKATQLYNKKKKEIEPNFIEKKYIFGNKDERTDLILIRVYNELGKDFNNSYSNISIYKIPSKYKNFFKIVSYDGKESIEIDYDKYTVENIHELMQNENLSSVDKLKQLKKIINQSITNNKFQ